MTCNLPLHPIPPNVKWEHLDGLKLSDPDFGTPGRIDVLLGVNSFVELIRNGRRKGAPGTPIAIDTHLGWVLAGNVGSSIVANHVVVHHSLHELLRQFWETEEEPAPESMLTVDERTVLDHFYSHHSHLPDGRFIVPLPRKPNAKLIGESRTQAVRRFISFERSLHAKDQFSDVNAVVEEYFEAGHAEEVPESDLHKLVNEVFYLPVHCVRKESSTTTKIRAVFDASAKSTSGVSVNDILLVGPTVHSSLVDVLLRFRLHRVALTADVSRMYRAIALTEKDKDLHRFVWRQSPRDPLKDYRMKRITFGVSASAFIANMCVKHNALTHAMHYPLAAKAVREAFYVDDGVTGADSVQEAIKLQRELHSLFSIAGFLLRKWSSSELTVLDHIDPELRDNQFIHQISEPEKTYTKTLGIEWNSQLDHFRLNVSVFPRCGGLTKRALVSDIAKTYDVLGWFSPTIVTAKILLQRVWEEQIQWDNPVPPNIYHVWSEWRTELPLLSKIHVPRCYYNKNAAVASIQLHGFSDASQLAYAGVVCLRAEYTPGTITTSLVVAKTKVAPIKKITIPRLELCGALILARLLHHCRRVLNLDSEQVHAWTDSTIVLNWLSRSPRKFKTYVGNRIAHIVEMLPAQHWRHVTGTENPADCASRGLMPSQLLDNDLWWHGPDWLRRDSTTWPKQPHLAPNSPSDEENELCVKCLHVITCSQPDPILPFDQYSSFNKILRITAWVRRFINNCQARMKNTVPTIGPLKMKELKTSERYWIALSQGSHFAREIKLLLTQRAVSRSSPLIPLNPFIDADGLPTSRR